MGLDMYLNGKNYLNDSWIHSGENDPISIKIEKLFPELSTISRPFGRLSVVEEVRVNIGYWRKANAIHKWFVDHVQEGEDNCGCYHVEREQLIQLKDACASVLADNSLAGELLPPTDGFFFGSSEVDEYYFDDLSNTIAIIDAALKLSDDWFFEYHSSW